MEVCEAIINMMEEEEKIMPYCKSNYQNIKNNALSLEFQLF